MNTLTLTALADQINAAHRAGEGAARKGLEHFRRAGQMLCAAKDQCAHGEWLPWLETHVEFERSTAAAYMRVAAGWDKCATAAHLTEALRLLTDDVDMEEDELEELCDDGFEELSPEKQLEFSAAEAEARTERTRPLEKTDETTARLNRVVRHLEKAANAARLLPEQYERGRQLLAEALGEFEPGATLGPC